MKKIIIKKLWVAGLLWAAGLGSAGSGQAACTYSISPTSATHGPGANTNTVGVTTAAACGWTTVNTNPWVTLLAGASGTGTGSVRYAVAANPNPVGRTGTVTIANQPFTVRQNPVVCAYALSPTTKTHGHGATSNFFAVETSGAGCAWTAANNDGWLTLVPPTSGSGDRAVGYLVAPNPDTTSWRTGLVFVADQVFALLQRPAPCVYDVAPGGRMHGHAGSSGTISVTANAGCAWSVTNGNAWVTVTAGASGSGDGSVAYTVAVNPSSVGRTGVVMMADQSFVVTQGGAPCVADLTPGSRTHGYSAATNMVGLMTPLGCAWSVVNTSSWIVLTSAASGVGDGMVGYRVTANPSASERTAVVVMGGEPFNVTQRGITCTVSLSPASRGHGHGATTNMLGVATSAACAWAVSTPDSWLTILAGVSGMGTGTVVYAVGANPSAAARTGALLIDDEVFTVTQDGAPCEYDLTPGMRTHGYSAATNTVAVAAPIGCAWSAINTNNWLTILSGASGVGDGTVRYAATANPNVTERAGVVLIGGQPFNVTQRGITCTVSLSPTNRSHGHGATTNAVSVTTSAACAWAVSTPDSWLTILAGASGMGTGTVVYAVSANPSAAARTGALLIDDEVFTVTQDGAPCEYDLTPGMRTHGYSAATNMVGVTAPIGCAWSAVNTNNWLTILSGASGVGDGTVRYAVAANPNVTERAGVVLIGGQPFNVTQRGITCTVSLSPTNRSHGHGATTNAVSVTTSAACAWAVSTPDSWLTILAGASGMGTGTVVYAVSANPSAAARTGALLIDDEVFTVTQDGAPCEYDLTPGMRTHGYSAATNMVGVTAPIGCAWSAVNTNNWLTILSGASGVGDGTVRYAVAANPNVTERAGVVLIGGQPFNVTQRGITCTVSLSPTNRSHGHGATTNAVSVTTSAACAWAVSTPDSWLTILAGASGMGTGTVVYAVSANPSAAARTGALLIDDEVFTVTQDGAPCEYDLTPGMRTHGYSAATNTVAVAAPIGCAWSAVNTNNWLTILSVASGVGDGTVRYAVAANPNVTERAGVVLIGGQPFNVTQRGITCTVSLSPTNRSHGHGATTNAVSVTTSAACAWAVSTPDSWLTILAGVSGMGTGTVVYAVSANPSSVARTGALLIDDVAFTLTQDGAPCEYDLTPGMRTHGHAATTNTFALTAPLGCSWNALALAPWITLLSDASGAGDATVRYAVASNTNLTDRTGTLLIGGESFNLTQRGITCTLSVSPTNRMHGHGGSASTVNVTTGPGCVWAASTTNAWITITAGASGAGSSNVAYSVAANPSLEERVGAIVVDGQVFAITQSGISCTYKISPMNRTHGFAAASGSMMVTVNSNCAWSVGNTNPWVTITSGQSGRGNGTVTYAVVPNLTNVGRMGFVFIGDQSFALSQRGATNGFDIESITILAGGEAKLRLSGEPSGVWRIQASTDLEQWTTIGSVNNVTGVVEYIDPDAVFSNRRFYRAVLP